MEARRHLRGPNLAILDEQQSFSAKKKVVRTKHAENNESGTHDGYGRVTLLSIFRSSRLPELRHNLIFQISISLPLRVLR